MSVPFPMSVTPLLRSLVVDPWGFRCPVALCSRCSGRVRGHRVDETDQAEERDQRGQRGSAGPRPTEQDQVHGQRAEDQGDPGSEDHGRSDRLVLAQGRGGDADVGLGQVRFSWQSSKFDNRDSIFPILPWSLRGLRADLGAQFACARQWTCRLVPCRESLGVGSNPAVPTG